METITATASLYNAFDVETGDLMGPAHIGDFERYELMGDIFLYGRPCMIVEEAVVHTKPDHITRTFPVGTVYVKGEMMGNIIAIPARDITVTTVRYAQYDYAIKIECTPKGKRKPRQLFVTYKPYLVVTSGAGSVGSQPLYGPTVWDPQTGAGVARSSHTAFSDQWATEFDSLLGDLPAGSLDLRKWNTTSGGLN